MCVINVDMKKIIFIIFLFLLFFSLKGWGIELYNLHNGLTVILEEKHTLPIVTAQIWCKAGSITENEFAGSGISHFIEHLLFTTTKKHTGKYIAQKVKSLGCDMNGYTSFEETVFHFTLNSENLTNILPIMKEMIFEPAFKKSEIEKERNIILKEINMDQDDIDRYFSDLIFQSVYEKSYYKYPVIGYKELFKNIKRKDIVEYYNRMYVPSNMALIIVGDFNKDKIKRYIKRIFGNISPRSLYPVYTPSEPEQVGFQKFLYYRKDLKLPRLAFAWKSVDIRSKDLFPLDVLSLIIGKGKSSILKRELKDKLNLVQSIDSYSYTPTGKGIFVIEAKVNEVRNINLVEKKIKTILNNFKVTDEELNKAKKMVLVDYLKGKESVTSYAADIGINWVMTDNVNFSGYYVENIKKVKKEDIYRVLKKYFNNNNLTLIELLPSSLKNNINKFNKDKSKSKIKEVTLKNKIKVLLSPDNSIPMISMNILFKGGVIFENKNKKGLTYFLSKLLIGDTKKYKREYIVSTFENNGGNISSFCGNNSFGIKTLFFKEDMDKVLPLLSDILIDSKFSSKEVEKKRREILNELKENNESLFGIAKVKLFNIMYKNTPYETINMGNMRSIKSITRYDIREMYKKLININNMIISISGDFKEINLVRKLNKYFGNLELSKKDLKINKVNKSLKRIITFKTNIDKKQSLLFISYYGASIPDNDRYKEELLWYILNGQGSRLFVNLREKKELAYYVGFFPFYGLKSGLINFYVGTVKDKINIAKKSLIYEINKLIKDGITIEELESAKKEAFADKIKEFQSIEGRSFNIGLWSLYSIKNIGINEYKRVIDKITVNDLNNFIKKYFYKKKYLILEIIGNK